MYVSYLSNPAVDMVEAALDLLRGSPAAVFYFLDEPGEHRFLLRRTTANSIHVTILWFQEWWFPRLADENGVELFSGDCAVIDFTSQIMRILKNILEK